MHILAIVMSLGDVSWTARMGPLWATQNRLKGAILGALGARSHCDNVNSTEKRQNRGEKIAETLENLVEEMRVAPRTDFFCDLPSEWRNLAFFRDSLKKSLATHAQSCAHQRPVGQVWDILFDHMVGVQIPSPTP